MSQRYHNRPSLPMSGSRDAGNLILIPLGIVVLLIWLFFGFA